MLLGDHLSKGRIRGLDGYLFCAYFHALADRRWVESEIYLALFFNLQTDVFLFGDLEALRLHSDGVNRYRQKRRGVVARVVGLHFARDTGALRGDFHRRSGDD